jgi:hypothetical protein
LFGGPTIAAGVHAVHGTFIFMIPRWLFAELKLTVADEYDG